MRISGILKFTWVFGLHLFLLLFIMSEPKHRILSDTLGLDIVSEPEFSSYYRNRREFLRRRFEHSGIGGTMFLGDSRVDGLDVRRITCDAINLGIGQDTSVGVRQRLADYGPLDRFSLIFLAVGLNDLKYRDPEQIVAHVLAIVEDVGSSIPMVLMTIIPVDESVAPRYFRNHQIEILNSKLLELARNSSVVLIDMNMMLTTNDGGLDPSYHNGDGVHLNRHGSDVVIGEIRRQLAKAPVTLEGMSC